MPVYRVTFTGIWGGVVNVQNVVAFRVADESSPAPLVVATEMRDGWCTILAAGQLNTFGWRNISLLELTAGATPYNLPVVVNGVDGVGNTDGTQCINPKWRIHTPFPGRSGRGRIYLPGFGMRYWTTGQLNATGITNISARLNAISLRYVGGAATSNYRLGVCTRGSDPSAFKEADFLSLSLTPGIQRRRNLGVGL